MDLKEKTKKELEARIRQLESFIEEKGLGSSYLTRARRIQRNINFALLIGGAVTFAGLLGWVLFSSEDEEEED